MERLADSRGWRGYNAAMSSEPLELNAARAEYFARWEAVEAFKAQETRRYDRGTGAPDHPDAWRGRRLAGATRLVRPRGTAGHLSKGAHASTAS